MFMEVLRQLASPDWACGMSRRADRRPKELPVSRPRHLRRKGTASFVRAEDLEGTFCQDSVVLELQGRNELEGAGLSEDDAFPGFHVSSPSLADLDSKTDAAYRKQLRGIHHKLQAELHQEATRQMKADSERTLHRGYAAELQESVAFGCNSQSSCGSAPDIDGSVILAERYDQTMEHLRVLYDMHKRSTTAHCHPKPVMREDCPLTLPQSQKKKVECDKERRKTQKEIDEYHHNMRQKLRELGAKDHATMKFKQNTHFAHTGQEGVHEYLKQAAHMDVYYPSTGESHEEMTKTQRMRMQRSIKILERSRT
jgi:hypothetical protein